MMKKFRFLALLAAMLVLVTGAAVACGGDDDDGNGNGNGDVTPAASPSNGNGDDTDDDDLTLVSKNTLFDKSELRAEAGEITITHDNQDAGIVHNVHVYRGSDASGEDMGMTELEAGPVTQTLTLNLEPGEYFYVCDAHPATMFGTLIVE